MINNKKKTIMRKNTMLLILSKPLSRYSIMKKIYCDISIYLQFLLADRNPSIHLIGLFKCRTNDGKGQRVKGKG